MLIFDEQKINQVLKKPNPTKITPRRVQWIRFNAMIELKVKYIFSHAPT